MLPRKNNLRRGLESLAVLVVLVLSLWSTSLSTAATKSKSHGYDVKFHRIDPHTDPAIVQFAESFVRNLIETDHPLLLSWQEEGKTPKPTELVRYLQVDLNNDGVPELILQVADGEYCGTAGCDSYVYRRDASGFKEICNADMYDLAVEILPQKENGYHLIDAGQSFIHWLGQPALNGHICRVEGKPGYQ